VKEVTTHIEYPSLTTFRKALEDERFKDVKRAPKHQHCRCDTCETLQNTLNQHGKTTKEYIRAKKEKAAHAADVLTWRDLEDSWVTRCAHNPGECAFYRGDDTEAVEFPKAGLRPLKKSANKTKLKVSHSGCGE
jgi:hypothetical protein